MDIDDEDPTLEMVLLGNAEEVQNILTEIGEQILELPSGIADWTRGVETIDITSVYFITRSRFIGNDDLLSEAQILYEKAEAIMHEKGYRFLMTLVLGLEY